MNKMKIINIETGGIITNEALLMEYAGLELHNGFEDIGIQGDNTPVVFDKCGNFGYLDINKYRAIIEYSA